MTGSTTGPHDASPADPEALRARAQSALLAARERTALLTSCVEDGELTAQHSPLMSPLVWDLAHIGNQEELWLLRDVGGGICQIASTVFGASFYLLRGLFKRRSGGLSFR